MQIWHQNRTASKTSCSSQARCVAAQLVLRFGSRFVINRGTRSLFLNDWCPKQVDACWLITAGPACSFTYVVNHQEASCDARSVLIVMPYLQAGIPA
ncbi:hypothetical protein SynSYN20_03194 [Synechococcus sp. SYN20]|nr:hypothetical protein SynSYN20_03194 [Synechococcus sp. SYN20]